MDYERLENKINIYLGLERRPVAVTFLKTEEDFKDYSADMRSHRVTYCNSVQLASKGKGAKLWGDSHACMAGKRAVGQSENEPIEKAAERRYSVGCFDNIEISAKAAENMIYCKESSFGVAVVPLAEAQRKPDVVIIVAEAYSIMRIVQGYSYVHGSTPLSHSCGLQALCQDVTSRVYETGNINISYLCPGTRLVAGWKPHEMAVGIPFSMLEDILYGIEKTINPYERDKQKKRIKDKLEEHDLNSDFIKFRINYDDGSYQGGKIDVNI